MRAQRKICKWVLGSYCVYLMGCNAGFLSNIANPTFGPNLTFFTWKMRPGMSKWIGSLNGPLYEYLIPSHHRRPSPPPPRATTTTSAAYMRQWTGSVLLRKFLVAKPWTNLSEIGIKIQNFLFMKMYLKMKTSAKKAISLPRGDELMKQSLHYRTRLRSEGNKCPSCVWKWSRKLWTRER